MTPDTTKKIVQLNLALAFFEGLFVLWQYIQTPSETGAAVLLGLSLLRLVIVFGVMLVLSGLGFLLVSSLRGSWLGDHVTGLFERTSTFWLLLPLLPLFYFLVFSDPPYLGPLANYRERSFPVLVWSALVIFQLTVGWLSARMSRVYFLESFRTILVPAGMAFVIVVAVIGFIVVTRIGLTPDEVYWQEAGVPLLFAQVLLVLAIGAILYGLIAKFHMMDSDRSDVLVCVVLWVIAFAVWAGTAAKPAYNTLTPAPPNFQGYPFGDAMLYDVTAQNFLIGKPIPADFWAKPLYSFFLSLLHFIAGQNFGQVILLQVAFLALIPPLMYLLTKQAGGRLAGVVAALLVIVREWNAIRLSNVVQVSHVKLLLSDIFAMGGMMLLTWLLLRWLERPLLRRAMPVAVGGAMGFLILMRGHPVLIVPFLFLLAFLFLRKDGILLRNGLLNITVGLLLVMLPWFWHVYDLTGRFAFQDNSSSFASKDAFVQNVADSSGADSASYEQFETQIVQQALTHPLDVAQFVSAHYMHNVVFSYILLPQSFHMESLRSDVKRMPFWGNWEGALPVESWFMLLINASILALGVGAAWKRMKGLIFIPVAIGAAYNLSVAVSRRSGWRFILPADWVTLVFYAIGLVQVIVIVHSIIKRSWMEEPVSTQAGVAPVVTMRSYALSGLPFVLITLALVLGHKVFPLSFPSRSTDELVQSSGWDAAKVGQFLQQKDAVIMYGKALYPVYFKSDVGALNYSWLSFAPKPYKRLAFYVIGPQPAGVIFPTASRPSAFPDGAEVIVLGCKTESGDIDALSVVVTSTDSPVLYERDDVSPLTCPLPEPQ